MHAMDYAYKEPGLQQIFFYSETIDPDLKYIRST